MATMFDKLNRELEVFGRRAQAALDEGKLQIELLRLKRQRDATARDVGLLVHRRERTGQAEPARIETLMARIDDLERDIARVERALAATREETVTVGDTPPPAATTPAEESTVV